MDKVEQFIHKHTFTASRTLEKGEVDSIGEVTKHDLARTLADFLASRKVHTAIDGEAVTLYLKMIVVTPDELRDLVKGFDQAKPEQGDLYAGDDAQAG